MALVFVLLVFSSSLMAANITIKANNEPLKSVLEKITQQTGYEFAYSNAINPNTLKVSVEANNQDSDAFFKEFFNKYGITYKIVGKTVSLTMQDKVAEQPQQKSLQPNQKVKISGVVLDEHGAPLPGVYVSVLGTKRGTSTDIDGSYELECTVGEKLKYSYVGFKDKEMTIGKSLNPFRNVVMAEDAIALESAVIIGYGNTQKIKDITGAISHVGSKEIQQAAMGSSITSVLQGKAAGVNVQIQSASPTSPVSVVIRGQSSLSGNNQPLWIIDGIPEYNDGVSGTVSNVLYSLNLNDVESIDILKDASSTAIYGSRAANGVIIVTTKSGKDGMKPTLEVSAKVGIQFQDFNSYDYFTSEDYFEFTRDAMRKEAYNRGSMDYFTRQYLDEAKFKAMNTSEFKRSDFVDLAGAFYLDNSTDWIGDMTQNPIQQQYDATLRGGQKAVNYIASLSYRDNQGIVKTGYSKMFSGRIRLEARISDAMKLRFNASGSTRNAQDKDGMLSVLKKIRPDLPDFNEDGSIFTKDSYTENPYTTLKNKNFSTGENIAAGLEFEYKFLKDFMFTSKANVNYANSETLKYNNSKYYAATGASALATRTWSRPKSDTKIWDNTLLYTKKAGKHDISASLTASMEKYQYLYYYMAAKDFPDDDVLNSFGDAVTMTSMDESYQARTLLSQIGRIQYNYDSKYLATFTLRRDGSSRFGKDSRWGWFPSFGLGWTITNEQFFKDLNIEHIVSFLKFRFSHGKSGSQNLSDYQWMTKVSSNLYNDAAGIKPSGLGNPNLQWEEAVMTDIALEMEFFNSRLRSSVGYFQKKSDDLIYSQSMPLSSSFSSMTANMASTTTKGFEFSLDFDIIKNSRWQLTYNVNGAFNNSYVDKFNNSLLQYTSTYTKIELGQKVGQWYGYETYQRLYGSAEEVTALKTRTETGGIQAYWDNKESDGDVYRVDQNGDGIINTEDKVYLGTQIPKLYGGMGFQLYIGNSFNVGATFTYSLGNKRFWSMPAEDVNYTGNYNQSNKIAGMSATMKKNSPYNAKTMPNATPYGDGYNGGSSYFNDYWLYDGSYLRLNAINVSYRLDKQYFRNTIVDNIEFTLQASNLFTLTSYPGFDPQGNFSTSTGLTSTMGVDNSTYPSAKTVTAGVKITFR